jgi:hypothetical protein
MRKPRVETVATPKVPVSPAVTGVRAQFGQPGLFAHHPPSPTAVGAREEKPRHRLASAAGARSPMGV